MTDNTSVWRRSTSPEALNDLLTGTMGERMGMRVERIGSDFIEATMPVDHRTKQPFGLLHGGASVALAETLGSLAAYLAIDADDRSAVGLEINANHIRAVRSGTVRGRVAPLHVGRRTHVWQTHIYDDQDRLVSVSRLTVAIVDRE